jgi:predicted nucleic acid-binding protein
VGPVAAVLVDAGPLYAYIDADDAHHQECVALLASHPGPLAVPVLVIAEVAHLVGTRLGAEPEVRFLGDLAGRAFVTVPAEDDDWLRIAELVSRYGDLPLGTVDASIVVAAERLGVTTIATLDRRHFGVVRPAHASAFELIP